MCDNRFRASVVMPGIEVECPSCGYGFIPNKIAGAAKEQLKRDDSSNKDARPTSSPSRYPTLITFSVCCNLILWAFALIFILGMDALNNKDTMLFVFPFLAVMSFLWLVVWIVGSISLSGLNCIPSVWIQLAVIIVTQSYPLICIAVIYYITLM